LQEQHNNLKGIFLKITGDKMETFERNLSILESMKETVLDYEFLLSSRNKPQDFSRSRKMDFVDIIMCMLNFFRKDAQIEVDNFLKNVKESDMAMSEQGFLKARTKIKPEAFTILNDVLVKDVYKKPEYFYTFKGYRLLAVDGTVVTLNNTEVMQEAFGYVETQTSKHAQAQASCLYDIENGVILHSVIDSYRSDERKLAIQHIEKLESMGLRNDLILFDRGYPSTKLIARLSEKDIKFVMRVSKKSTKEVNDFSGEDGVVEIKSGESFIKVRVINTVLKTGETEKLITNLLDADFTPEEFRQLYFKRWGIETRYDFLKNKLEIENFTGESKLIICQDFYASIYLANLCELMKSSSDEAIRKEREGKDLKRDYKTNQKRLIAKLKDNLIKVILEEDIVKKEQLFNQLIDEVHKKPIVIRPGRSFPRVTKGRTVKFPKNKKRSM